MWCDYKGQMEMIDKPSDAPKHIRCPKCGRRLKPTLQDCHWYICAEPCWHYGVPKHKIKGYKKKSKTPNRKRK